MRINLRILRGQLMEQFDDRLLLVLNSILDVFDWLDVLFCAEGSLRQLFLLCLRGHRQVLRLGWHAFECFNLTEIARLPKQTPVRRLLSRVRPELLATLASLRAERRRLVVTRVLAEGSLHFEANRGSRILLFHSNGPLLARDRRRLKLVATHLI